jgi:hypothetical protein
MVSYSNFRRLDPAVRDVAVELLTLANRQQSEMMSFVTVWMAFNGWMAAVTGCERDAEMINALAADRRVNTEFDRLMGEDAEFHRAVEEFVAMWPVLNVRDVRAKLGFDAFRRHDRNALLAACVAGNVKQQPIGWAPGAALSWELLLRTIYQVRCNFFHGEKSPQDPRDWQLVRHCDCILRLFIADTGCFGWDDR